MTSVDETLSKLAGSALVIFVGTVVGQIFGLVGELLIIRSLSPDLFGLLSFAYTIVFVLGSVILLGVHEGVTRKMSATTSGVRQGQLLQSGYLLVLGSGILTVLGGYFGRNALASFVSMGGLPEVIVLFLPYLLIYPASQISFATLRAQKRSIPAILSRHIAPRTASLSVLFVALAVGKPFSGAIVYWLLVPAVWLVVSTYFVSSRISPSRVVSRKPSFETARDLWAFSWPLAAGSVVFLLLRNLDIFMIGYFLDTTGVGLYRSIQPLSQVTTFALTSFTFLFLPVATEYYEDEHYTALNQLYTVSTKWILTLTFPPVLLFAFFSPDVIRLLFGTEYVAAAPAMSILIGGLAIRAVTGLNGDMVRAIDRPRIELYSALVGVVGNFVGNLFLVPRLGIVGAAVATVIGYAMYNVAETAWVRHEVGITPSIVANSKMLVLPLLVASVLAYGYRGEVGGVGLLLVALTLTAVQIVSVFVSRSIDEADIALLSRLDRQLDIDLAPVTALLERRM